MKALKYIGAGVLSILLFIAVLAFSSFGSAPDLEQTFEPEIPSFVEQIASWDKEIYQKIMTDEGYSQLSPDKWQAVLEVTSQIGSLISQEKPELESFTHYNAFLGNDRTVAVYNVVAAFEGKETGIRLSLIYTDDQLKVHGIKFTDVK